MTMRDLFLSVLALGAVLVALNAIRTGIIAWRSGMPAQNRRDNPRGFWLLIAACLAIAAAIFAPVLMDKS